MLGPMMMMMMMTLHVLNMYDGPSIPDLVT